MIPVEVDPVRVSFETLSEAPRGYWIAIVDDNLSDEETHAIVMRGARVAFDPSDGWRNGRARHNYLGYGYELVSP